MVKTVSRSLGGGQLRHTLGRETGHLQPLGGRHPRPGTIGPESGVQFGDAWGRDAHQLLGARYQIGQRRLRDETARSIPVVESLIETATLEDLFFQPSPGAACTGRA